MSETESQQLRAPLPEDKPKRKRWLGRLRVLVLLVLFLIFASRAIVVVLLPPVLHRVAGYYGLDASYQRLELSVLGGDTGLWNLVISPKGSNTPLMTVDYCRGDISTLNLLRGRLAVWRVEADGVNFAVDRNADGSVPLLNLINANLPASSNPTPAAKAASQPKPWNFSPPLRLDALRLTHIRAHIRDQAIKPPLDTTFSVNLRLSDLGGTGAEPTKFSADIDADPILDAMHVTGTGQFKDKTIDATFQANMNGLRLRPLAPYLALLGIRPLANETSLRAGGELKLAPSSSDPAVASAELQLHDASLIADGEEAAGLDQLLLDAPSLDPHRLGLKQLTLNNVRLSGRRAANGNVRFAGLEYVGLPAATAATTQPAPAAPLTLPIVELPIVDVKGLSAHVHDDAITPAADLSATVDDFTIKQILIDPAHPDAAIDVSGLAHAPGIAGNIHLNGSIKPMAVAKSLSLNVNADGVELSAIRPYLAAFGVSSGIRNGTFTAAINADATVQKDRVLADASFNKIKLADDHDLFAMDHATLKQAAVIFDPPAITLGDCSISGPTLAVTHEADGSISAAGLRFDPRSIPKPTSPLASETTSVKSAATTPLPALAVDHFLWNGINVSIDDNTLSPPLHTRVVDTSIEWKENELNISGKVPKIVEQFSAKGNLSPTDHSLSGKLTLAARGINASIAAPFLAPLHLEPTLHAGSIEASVDRFAIPLDGPLAISNVRYLDGNTELAGVDDVVLDGIKIVSPTSISLVSVDIKHPRATVTRETGGAFAAGGLRILPAAFETQPSDPAVAPMPSTQPVAAAKPPDIRIKRLHVDEGELRFVDQVKAIDTTASTTLDLEHIALGETADFTMNAAISGVIDSATIHGKLGLDPNAPSADLTVQAHNIRAGQLAAYLPPGITVPLQSGDFQSQVHASVLPATPAGVGIKLIAGPLDFRETGAKTPYLKLDGARAIASRIDPTNGVYKIDELSTAGVELSAARTPAGGSRAMGVAIESPPASIAPIQLSPDVTPTTRPAESVQSLLARSHRALPAIQLDQLNVNLRRITLLDEMRPAAVPLVISDLRFRNLDKLDWGGADPDAHAPTHFRMDCTLDPAVGLVTVLATANPLMSQPAFTFDVVAAGINGDGITALVPEVKSMIHGSELVDGQFHLHGDTTLRLSRRGDSQIDFTAPIDADLDLKPIHFRAAANGPILAGVDEIQSEGIHLEPKTGAVHVKTIEITKPIGRVSREKDGVHLLGIVFQPPAPATEPTTEAAGKPLNNPATAPALRPAKPAAEVRVDQLVINDLDFIAEDRVVNPPLIVPLTGLDVEVRDFTNMAPYEDRPLKFSALVNAGKVPLPRKKTSGSTTQPTEERELFAQASANGSIGLYPAPNGYIRTALGGFELGALTSEAAQYGVKLSDGVFDSSVDAKLPGDGSIQTKAKFVFTDLILNEPPDGPIAKFLHLGAPLDVVVGALQDPDGSITIPLDFPVKNLELSPAALAGPAVGAFASIAATAVASAPLKAASAFGDLLGMGGKKVEAPEPPVTMQFESGDTTLSRDDMMAITALKTRLTKDAALTVVIKHVLGGGDVREAETRSNPTTQEAESLAKQMRDQQLASAELRSDLAGVARSAIERGTTSADTLQRLKQVDQQMAQTDDAMDRLYDMLRPGADRMASRRTRTTCLAYGKDRLGEIQSALLDHMPPDVADRVHVLTPQYSEPTDDAGGTVIVQLIPKKK